MKSFSNLLAASIFFILLLPSIKVFAQEPTSVDLNWLGKEPPGIRTGVSWGIPFERGKVTQENAFSLNDKQGKELPLQSWKLAYWPDGSLKWVGFASVLHTNNESLSLKVVKKGKQARKNMLKLTENEYSIKVNTGLAEFVIPREGDKIINSISIKDKVVSSGGSLICLKQEGPEVEVGTPPEIKKYIGNTSSVTIEQNGPVRAVLKLEGEHRSENGESWLPFIVRLYFYAGMKSVKMVHTIVYDGDQYKDFIRGLGVNFEIPMDEEVHNRHVRFSGENNGFWDEPVQPANGRIKLYKDSVNLYEKQLKGERLPNKNEFSEKKQFLLDHWASWNDFKLVQNNAEGFVIKKRTNDKSSWIDAGAGGRSRGLVFAGDVSGGLAITIKNFWESYPSALEVRNAKSDKAEIRAWLWSPEGPAMDLRPYDTLAWGHSLEASYEDAQPGHSTPEGIARTSELLLFATSNVPSLDTLNAIAEIGNNPPLLGASPEYIHEIPVFGAWSLPDRSTNGKRWLEDQLQKSFEFYQAQVEQRNWYGFWDYGDVMHGYDADRHEWKYDMGGYAWDNTELMPNMWLWYQYLRTGKEDVFRMAEALTRHTGEVDVYHAGPFKGFGSRHNVLHWGGGAKEVRIAQAALQRFYYYLTTDERTGDLMRASAEASNSAIGKLDPVRLIMKKSKYPTHARVGPDWLALVGNWMTEWERTGDDRYKAKILTGVNNLAEMPYGMFSAKDAAFGYDPETNELYRLGEDDIGYLHLSVLMGGPEVSFELIPLLASNKWEKLWMQFCKIYGAPVEEINEEFGREVKLGDAGPWYSRLAAYYYSKTGDEKYAKRAWETFLDDNPWGGYTTFDTTTFNEPESLGPIDEVPGVSTNNTAQWSLNAIELLELAGYKIPEDHPRFNHDK
ncbi:hypothetical protein C7S20_10245 [Christiangramia fulva]|uniref:Tat pathway signal sequence domain protein n=1 Tax=Christiangramia fulva TaxID=2126553 RepID=A0A2R3Z5Q7_9FLAO|nr:hypothetical protein [Christiangramia fulva]AVR45613.1 hypothetical protein C7S20_10245 [Christiangramia fulva]